MKTTVNVNLAGIAYTLDKDAYETLKSYLEDIESRLPQDESKEVLEDIEARISELIGKNCSSPRSVWSPSPSYVLS